MNLLAPSNTRTNTANTSNPLVSPMSDPSLTPQGDQPRGGSFFNKNADTDSKSNSENDTKSDTKSGSSAAKVGQISLHKKDGEKVRRPSERGRSNTHRGNHTAYIGCHVA